MSAVAGRSTGATRGRIRLTPRAAILGVILIALLFSLVVPLRTYMAQRDRLSRLESQTLLLERRNAALQAQIGRLKDPAYLERVARECLGMVRPGEIGFVVVPRGAAARATDC